MMATPFLIFSNIVAPVFTGVFCLLYLIYFSIAKHSKAVSNKFFLFFLFSFSLFVFGRPLQLTLGPHPIPLIIVNIRLFILCSVVSPLMMLGANIFKEKTRKSKTKESVIIIICALLGIAYCVFNTLGTHSSYILFQLGHFKAYDNFTPSLSPPFYGREITIIIQVITGILLAIFSIMNIIKLRFKLLWCEIIGHKVFLINSGILIFALTFIAGSIAKQWWLFYASSVFSALLIGASVIKDLKELYDYYDKLIPFIKDEILNNVRFSEFSKANLTEMLHCLGKKEKLDTFIMIKTFFSDSSELKTHQKKQDQLIALCKKNMTHWLNEENFIILPLKNNQIGIVLNLLDSNIKAASILDILDKTCLEFNQSIKEQISIGIGRSYNKIEELKTSFYEASQALEYAGNHNGHSIFHIDDLDVPQKAPRKYPVKEKDKLLSLIKIGDIENTRKTMGFFFTLFMEYIHEKPDIMKIRMYELMASLIDSAILGGGDEEKLNDMLKQYISEIEAIKDLGVFENWFKTAVMDIVKRVASVFHHRSSRLIKKAEEFIENHYAESISYKDAAKAIFISPSYFQSLFKQETGQTFVDYLTNYRITKAKELLQKSDYSITQIAFETGFKNSNYFSSTFKKIVGDSAKNYRKSKLLKEFQSS